MRKMIWALASAAAAIAVPAAGQAPAPASSPVRDKEVEGATADRVARIAQCQGHKFDTLVRIDPVRNRSTRVKLCADPGASDADWVRTLEAAVDQIEARDMPAEAKDKVIAELRQEIAKFGLATPPATTAISTTPSQSAAAFVGNLGTLGNLGPLEGPTERYETSIVPPLPPPLPRRILPTGAGTSTTTASGAFAAAASTPIPAMRFRVKCLARGETGAGSTCDFFDKGTTLSLSAVEGLEKGGTLRFRRKGEARGELLLAPLAAGQSVRVRLPAEICRGVAFAKVELELLPPGSRGAVAARAGPYGMRC